MVRRLKLSILLLIFLLGLFPKPVLSCTSFAVYGQEVIYGWNLDWLITGPGRLSIQRGAGDIQYFILEYQMAGTFRRTVGNPGG